jgi:tyrosinase
MRKNIDALSADELATYKHALDIVIHRGTTNPSAMDGYAWQAALHNDFERERPDGSIGACEHRSELFFPWHRAHLAGFEKILRETDAPRTSNVTLPYWDWTQAASGTRFPAAFEDQSSPLFHAGRFPDVTPSTPRIQWDAEEVKTKMVQEPDWLLFAGDPPDPSGGSFGWVESGPHNTIHGAIGPTMGNPTQASRDPIYWSFHSYIDLIWTRWQRVHTNATTPQPFSTPDTTIWVEPFTPPVRDMAQTDTLPTGFAYGYDYDFSIDAPAVMVAGADTTNPTIVDAQPAGEFAVTSRPLRLQSLKRQILRVRDVVVLPDATYTLRVYVHPPNVDISTISEDERARYLADKATVWMSGGHTHRPTNLNLDLTRAVAAYGGSEFSISILTDTMPLPAGSQSFAAAKSDLDKKVAASGPLWRSLVLEEH